MLPPSLINLDKSTWQRLPFGEIAQSIGERVDPTSTDLETYVGLEHIDPESIHIKRFGKREDVSGQKLRCYPGDVIFGRRRAYQRKAAICEFDGFCSAHSLVLRAIPEVIDPKLFPFFLHSDQFMHRAVDISVGGLSPTINWTKLKEEEFLLPPREQQTKVAELLWAADATVESHLDSERKFVPLIRTSLSEIVQGSVNESKRKSFKLEELINVKHGFPFKSQFWAEDDGELPIAVTIGNYDYSGGFRFQSTTVKCYSGDYPPDYDLDPGDLLLAMTCQTPDGIILGIPGVIPNDGRLYLHNQRIGKIELKTADVDPRFLYLTFLTDDFRRHVIASASGTKVLHTSPTKIISYQIDLPSMEEQAAIVRKFDQIFAARQAQNQRSQLTKTLQKSLINQIF